MKNNLFLLLACLVLHSCDRPTKSPEITVIEGVAMTVPYRITIGAKGDPAHLEVIAWTVFSHIDTVFNKWNPDSELSNLNRLKKEETASLSQAMTQFLLFTDQMVKKTEGRFDPTIESIQGIWKSHLEQGVLPPQELIDAVKPAVGWSNLSFSQGFFSKNHDATQLDLGGIAKGHCVDLLVKAYNDAGYSDLLVDWGGELKSSGKHPSGRPWRVFIRNFETTNPSNALGIAELIDQAIATSGDYLQNWKVAERRVSHILNPFTLEPQQITDFSVGSVSIMAETCAEADALATAAMLFPTVEEAKTWLDSFEHITTWVTSSQSSP